MKMTTSRSRTVESYGYEAGTLRVRFRGGRTYEYRDVPAHVYAQFTASESHGNAFGQLIRGRFKGRRIP